MRAAAVDAVAAVDAINASLVDMRHRGPDEGGVWSDDDVVIGFRRLSIIDIDHSHQPLPWLDGRYHLIFNGEIYNYLELRERLAREFGATFETDGDGEAIVAGYHYLGEKVVRELRGMFAFLIWDSHERVLFGARDWFGIKPLYTYSDERGSYFSSEKKSLLDVAAPGVAEDIDTTALQQYLTLQYVPEPASMHTRIRRIESGTYFTLRPGETVRPKRYFHPDFAIRPVSDPDKLYREIAEALEDSVEKHMRADVTVGSFLSGGIDSTAVAALAKRHNPDLLTFTTGFERAGFSEIDVAAESAAAIGVEHITKVVSPQEMMDALPLIVWYLDDPVADPALVPLYFIAREARKHVKVVLSGEGADELFGGYTIYREPISLRAFEKVPGVVKKGLGRLSTRIPEGTRGKDLLRRGSIGIEERYYGNARIFRSEELVEQAGLRTFDPSVSYMDVTRELYAQYHPPRRLHPHAVRGPVHLAARRHPGQGRQDDDGQLVGAAGAVPGHRGVRGRVVDPHRPEADQGDHQVRPAPGPRADRARPRHQPAQARLPGPDPALAQGRDVRVGAGDHHRVRRRRAGRPLRRAGPARCPPRRAARLLTQDLDPARAADLARHLRRAPDRDHPAGTGVPGPALSVVLTHHALADFRGVLEAEYAPRPDGRPDPGEIVWTWVPYEDDPARGKDRPVLLVGHDGTSLLALMLTSKDHDRDAAQEARAGRHWHDIGTGDWDSRHRPSEVRLDRVLRVDPAEIRREGAVLPRTVFDEVIAAARAVV